MYSKKIKNFSIKSLLILIGIIIGLGLTVFSASVVWKGTEKIKNGEVIMASDIKNNFEFLKSKIKKYSCPAGQSIQELDLTNGTFKCSDGGGNPSNPPAPQGSCGGNINSCTSGTFSNLPDNSTNYLWKCGTKTCSKAKKKYQPPVIQRSGLDYKCISGLDTCFVIGTSPTLEDCLQPGASDLTGRECTNSRTFCRVSFSGAIWGIKPSGNQESCVKGAGVNSDKLWKAQGSQPASWCRGYPCGPNGSPSFWCRDGVASIYTQECK